MEALDHVISVQVIAQRQQDHALMVSHVGTDNRAILACSQTLSSKIGGFVQAIQAKHVEFLEALKILDYCQRRIWQSNN
jgi:hypothetical protein